MARTLRDATNWFLKNHHGTLSVIGADGSEAAVESFVEAEAFFRIHGESA